MGTQNEHCDARIEKRKFLIKKDWPVLVALAMLMVASFYNTEMVMAAFWKLALLWITIETGLMMYAMKRFMHNIDYGVIVTNLTSTVISIGWLWLAVTSVGFTVTAVKMVMQVI